MTGEREEGGDAGAAGAAAAAAPAGVEEAKTAAEEEESGVTKPTWRTFGPITGRLGRLRSIEESWGFGASSRRGFLLLFFINFIYGAFVMSAWPRKRQRRWSFPDVVLAFSG